MYNNLVTGITAVYKTTNLIKNAYESFRNFYPELELIIINNSDDVDECTAYLKDIVKGDDKINLIEPGKNIGHGDAVDVGLHQMKTPWGLVFDSDVTFNNGTMIEKMFSLAKNRVDIYGVGLLLKLDRGGRRPAAKYIEDGGDIISYLYPALCLIQFEVYKKFHRFTTFGLPPLKAMLEIYDKKMVDILIDFPVWHYARHLSGATRAQYGHYEQIAPDDIKKREKLRF